MGRIFGNFRYPDECYFLSFQYVRETTRPSALIMKRESAKNDRNITVVNKSRVLISPLNYAANILDVEVQSVAKSRKNRCFLMSSISVRFIILNDDNYVSNYHF